MESLSKKPQKPGWEEYEKAKQYEREGDMKAAVSWYRKAEKLGHDLQDDVDPEEQFAYSQSDDDPSKPKPADESVEKEDILDLSEEASQILGKYEDALSYKFTQEQKSFLEENGYLVIKNVIPHDLCDQMIRECFERAHKLWGVTRMNHSTWSPLEGGGFIDIWHTPAYYKIRQLPSLYSIFAQLLQEPKLTVSMDRVCMKPPAFLDVPDPDSDGATFVRFTTEQGEFPIHTDMNLWYLQETKYQGGVALDNCPIGGGGFRCVPGFHKLEHIREYRRRFEAGELHVISVDAAGNKRRPTKMSPPSVDSVFEYFADDDWKAKCIEVPLEKGDFVVWNSRLPHSNLPNTSDRWRVHCYVRFVPADAAHQRYRDEVKRAAETGVKPKYYSTGNRTSEYYDKWEMEGHDISSTLSPLGRKLVGLGEW